MIYKEIKPSGNIDAIVDCFWTISGDGVNNIEKIQFIADGCFELIFNLGNNKKIEINNNASDIEIGNGGILGCVSQNINLSVSSSDLIVGVMFKPIVASSFLKLIPMNLTINILILMYITPMCSKSYGRS